MAQSQEAQQDSSAGTDLNFHYYWTVIRKRKLLIAAIQILVAAGVVAWTSKQPRVFQAMATVIIDPTSPNVLGAQTPEVVQLGTAGFWTNEDYYNTQYRILRSRSLAERVVRTFNLHHDTRLLPEAKAAALSEDDLIAYATSYVQAGIRVLPIKDSRVVGIAFRDRNPDLARDIANDVVEVFVSQNLDHKLDETKKASEWISQELDKQRHELDSSETALYTFKREKDILSVSLEDRQNLTAKGIEQFSEAQNDAKRRRLELEGRRRAVARMIASDPLSIPSSYVSDSKAVEQKRLDLYTEENKLKELEKRYEPKHPEWKFQAERVEAARASLKAEARTLLRSLDGEIRALADAEGAYQAEVDRHHEEALQLAEQEIKYKDLKRKAENDADVYTGLLKRLNESGLQAQNEQANNIRPLDEALRPGAPVEPNMKNAAVLGLALGMILAMALAFFVEFIDRSVTSQQDVENVIGLPFLGMVPSVDGGGHSDMYVAHHPKSTVAEHCRVVRTNILFCGADKPLKTLVVTSSNPLEGKTMTVVNLGIVMAQSGQRTLLVDTDMRRPRLHKAMGASNENGVSRLIVGETTIEEAVKLTEVPNLFILPCGPIPPNPAELLQTEKFLALADQLRERFDRIIFDSPPVIAVTDGVVLSRLVDGTVLVVRAGRTPRDTVIRAKQLIKSVNSAIVGVVLNDVNLKNPHYATYYQYYQYKYHDDRKVPIAPIKEGPADKA